MQRLGTTETPSSGAALPPLPSLPVTCGCAMSPAELPGGSTVSPARNQGRSQMGPKPGPSQYSYPQAPCHRRNQTTSTSRRDWGEARLPLCRGTCPLAKTPTRYHGSRGEGEARGPLLLSGLSLGPGGAAEGGHRVKDGGCEQHPHRGMISDRESGGAGGWEGSPEEQELASEGQLWSEGAV